MRVLGALATPAGVRRSYDCALAGLFAATLSGVPSTVLALRRRQSPLDALRAAGTLVGRPTLAAGVAVHVGVSTWWSIVLCRVLPRRHGAPVGVVAGLLIGYTDLAVADRWFPAVADLPRAGQLADHVAFGAVFGAARGALSDARLVNVRSARCHASGRSGS